MADDSSEQPRSGTDQRHRNPDLADEGEQQILRDGGDDGRPRPGGGCLEIRPRGADETERETADEDARQRRDGARNERDQAGERGATDGERDCEQKRPKRERYSDAAAQPGESAPAGRFLRRRLPVAFGEHLVATRHTPRSAAADNGLSLSRRRDEPASRGDCRRPARPQAERRLDVPLGHTDGFKSADRIATGMNAGDRVRVERGDVTHEGVLMPSTTESELVVKLEGGYNVGVDREAATVDVLDTDVYAVGTAGDTESGSEVAFDDDLPTVALISTGGTIASTVDYRTGAVTAQFDAEDVLRAVPDLAGRANYRGRVVANILSENMTSDVWQELAEAVREEIEAGADGVVVMHGTDTMQYTASALAFMLDTPVPVVFTGSQRSADRPSSDNVMNAVCAVEAATADCAEVMVCMHAGSSDDRCALHRGTRVRKNHTSRRDAFETVGAEPLGHVDYDAASAGESGAVTFHADHTARGEKDLRLAAELNDDVELLNFTPGMDAQRLERLAVDGLVVEGTGLGHVHTDLVSTLDEMVDDGTVVAMTSACIEGRVCDRVYDTGRDLLDAGVVEAEDTLPETAYVKLMWALANRDDPAATMGESLAGEATDRSTPWQA